MVGGSGQYSSAPWWLHLAAFAIRFAVAAPLAWLLKYNSVFAGILFRGHEFRRS